MLSINEEPVNEPGAETFRSAPNDNGLLGLLRLDEYDQFGKDLVYTLLPQGTLLADADQPIKHVYFLTSGICSIIAMGDRGKRVEAGIVGAESFVPSAALTGVKVSSYQVLMQISGDAYSMEYSKFLQWLERSRTFTSIIVRANEALLIQVVQTALSNAVHDVNERLARWLLMCQDRLPGDTIELTHQFLSLMLAVRRSSVTDALHALEGRGFIRAERGRIVIRNRRELEEFSNGAYGKSKKEFERLMNDHF